MADNQPDVTGEGLRPTRRQFLELGAGLGLVLTLTPSGSFAQGRDELTIAIPGGPRRLGSRLSRIRPRRSRGHEELLPVHDRVRRDGAGRRTGDGYRHHRARLRRIVGRRCGRKGLDAEGSQGRQVPERKRNDGKGRQVVEGPRLRREGERGRGLSPDRPDRGKPGRGRRRLHGALHPVAAERSLRPHPGHLPVRVRLRRAEEARHRGRPVGQGVGHEEPAERRGPTTSSTTRRVRKSSSKRTRPSRSMRRA